MSRQPDRVNRTQSELLLDLREGTPREQSAALTRLALIGEAEALDAVIDHLSDQDEDSNGIGLQALIVLANKFAPPDRYSLAEVVIPYLYADDWGQRLHAVRLLNTHPNEMAIDALRDLVDDAREKVISEQRHRFSSVRLQAERTLHEGIMALANCGRLLVLPDILEMMDDPDLRIVATRAIGMIGSETERLRLEDLIEDSDPRVRDSAQWALGLMDERMNQFLNPPTELPELPPDRLHPLYWSHRKMQTDADDLTQFLVVRLGIEHLILDTFFNEGRIPDQCIIALRAYDGDEPPDFRENDAPVDSMWRYRWDGPQLTPFDGDVPPGPEDIRLRRTRFSIPSITITYPRDLSWDGKGLVSVDSLFEAKFGRGSIFLVSREDDDQWLFSLLRRTWAF